MISSSAIDPIYKRAQADGALGRKIAGAGYGGFLLLHCPKEVQPRVRQALSDLLAMVYRFDWSGARIALVQ